MKEMYFIVGTGTEIGKTYSTLKLLKQQKNLNRKITALKPVETGRELFGKNLEGSDTWQYSKFLNESLENINLYFLKKACSPHLAAELEKKKIEKEKIIKFIKQRAKEYDIIYVEGAGGLIVPFAADYTFLDLVLYFKAQAEVIIVADNKLGAINELMLTIEVLRQKSIRIKGIIYNVKEEGRDNMILQDNEKTVFRLSGVKKLEI